MLKLTREVKYTVLAVFDLAVYSKNKEVTLAEISRRQNIPLRFLEQIFHKLKKAGIVKAKRGPGGGYFLQRNPEKITIGDLIRAVEGPIVLSPCHIKSEKGLIKCAITDRCLTDFLWSELEKKIACFFDSVSIADLCGKRDKIFKKRKILMRIS